MSEATEERLHLDGGPTVDAGPRTRPASPPPRADIEQVLAKLDHLWEADEPAVPSWAAHELTFGQLRLLFLLNVEGPVAIGRIAEWLHVGLPTASGIVDRLERHGLVDRQHRLDDRRIVECALTDAGQRLLDDIVGMRSNAIGHVLDVLSAEELAQLDRLLQAVIERSPAGDRRPTRAPRQPSPSSDPTRRQQPSRSPQ